MEKNLYTTLFLCKPFSKEKYLPVYKKLFEKVRDNSERLKLINPTTDKDMFMFYSDTIDFQLNLINKPLIDNSLFKEGQIVAFKAKTFIGRESDDSDMAKFYEDVFCYGIIEKVGVKYSDSGNISYRITDVVPYQYEVTYSLYCDEENILYTVEQTKYNNACRLYEAGKIKLGETF